MRRADMTLIVDDASIEMFTRATCALHDACVTKIGFETGSFVDVQGALHPANGLSQELSIHLESQQLVDRIVVLHFQEIEVFEYVFDLRDDGIIYGCSITRRGDSWVWACNEDRGAPIPLVEAKLIYYATLKKDVVA